MLMIALYILGAWLVLGVISAAVIVFTHEPILADAMIVPVLIAFGPVPLLLILLVAFVERIDEKNFR